MPWLAWPLVSGVADVMLLPWATILLVIGLACAFARRRIDWALLSGLGFGVVLGGPYLLARFPLIVQVGAEGVALRSLLRRKFLPYARIAGVELRQVEGAGQRLSDASSSPVERPIHLMLRFVLDDGSHLDVGTGIREVRRREDPFGPLVFGEYDKLGNEIAREVRRHLDAIAGGRRAVPPLEQRLARHGRRASEWLREVETLAREGDAYRASGADEQALWDVLENPAASPSARVAAAFVLRASTEPSALEQRARPTVEACVAPELREAMELALFGEASDDGERPSLFDRLE